MTVIEIETGDSDVVEVETSTDTVEITSSGQPGPPGPTGPTGATGPQGPQGVPGVAAGRIFYFAPSQPSDITGYKKLLDSPSPGAETTIAVVCTGTGDVPVGSFATEPGSPGVTSYPAGTAYRHWYVQTSTGVARLRRETYIRTAAGVETLARSDYSPTFANTAVDLLEWSSTGAAAFAMDATDRLVVKVFAQRVSGPANLTVTAYFEGAAHASHVQTTISAGAVGPPGPQGPPGEATTPVIVLTQAEYDLLSPPDPDSLYVIIN